MLYSSTLFQYPLPESLVPAKLCCRRDGTRFGSDRRDHEGPSPSAPGRRAACSFGAHPSPSWISPLRSPESKSPRVLRLSTSSPLRTQPFGTEPPVACPSRQARRPQSPWDSPLRELPAHTSGMTARGHQERRPMSCQELPPLGTIPQAFPLEIPRFRDFDIPRRLLLPSVGLASLGWLTGSAGGFVSSGAGLRPSISGRVLNKIRRGWPG